MPEAKEASCLLGTNAKNAGKNYESVQKKKNHSVEGGFIGD